VDSIEGVKDSDRFHETAKALALVGVKGNGLKDLMRAICIVLQLGNIGFRAMNGDPDKSEVATKEELTKLSSLMGIPESELRLAFIERTMKTRTESYKVPLNVVAARDACDALAKDAYQRIFLSLVRVINQETSLSAQDAGGTIGLLDIFGFESFETNSYEQLCINYANEKLQKKFTEDIFSNVQEEYEAEGIPLSDIFYDDNTDVLNLIEGKTGLLSLLNEETIRPGTDFNFVQKSLQNNKASPVLIVHKMDRMSFGIRHYAGTVMYHGDSFVTKNRDSLPVDLQHCAERCSNVVIRSQTQTTGHDTNSSGGSGQSTLQRSKIVAPTVWTKYKGQLKSLMDGLKMTQSRYIRCIKPNTMKQPHELEQKSVVDQLRCAGVVAAVTISRSAFPNKLSNTVVLVRYSHLKDRRLKSKTSVGMTTAEQNAKESKLLMSAALKEKEISKDGKIIQAFVVGKTKTFFRAGALEWLESNRVRDFDDDVVILQRAVRAFLLRNRAANKRKRKLDKERKRMEATKQAEADHKKRMAERISQLRTTRKTKLQRLEEKIEFLKTEVKSADIRKMASLATAYDRVAKAKRATEELAALIKHETEHGAKKELVTHLVMEQTLEGNKKKIWFLKKGNKRARKENARIRTQLAAEKSISAVIDGGHRRIHGSATAIEESATKESSAQSSMSEQLEQVRASNERVRKEVMTEQDIYLDEARKRLQIQKIMARLVKMVQETIPNKNLVEEVVVTALGAESTAKAIMVNEIQISTFSSF
jgi:myosin heavy subunit